MLGCVSIAPRSKCTLGPSCLSIDTSSNDLWLIFPPGFGMYNTFSYIVQESGVLLDRLHSSASLSEVVQTALSKLGFLSLGSWLSLSSDISLIDHPPSEASLTSSSGSWSCVGETNCLLLCNLHPTDTVKVQYSERNGTKLLQILAYSRFRVIQCSSL